MLKREESNTTFYPQVVHFMLSHSDTVSAILRNRTISPVPAHLEEIALLTAVISRAAGWNSLNEDSSAAVEIRGQLSRLEQITLNLLPVCILSMFFFYAIILLLILFCASFRRYFFSRFRLSSQQANPAYNSEHIEIGTILNRAESRGVRTEFRAA